MASVVKEVFVPLVLLSSAVGLALWTFAPNRTPTVPDDTPRPPGVFNRVRVVPAGPGRRQLDARVGDVIAIEGVPYSPATPNGFAVYAEPSAVQLISPNEYRVRSRGTIHISYGTDDDVFVQVA